MTSQTGPQPLSADSVRNAIAEIFEAAGVPTGDAAEVAAALVESELGGLASHGVMLVPMYLDRILAGSVSVDAVPTVVHEFGAVTVVDAGHGLGQISAIHAMKTAIGSSRQHGVGVVAVRNGFHFGAAGRFSQLAADEGCIGIVASNTRPLMAAPGGAERIVGNNPIAIAVPVSGSIPLSLDMALSEVSIGRIRMAAREGQSIPLGWATDSSGVDTSDPDAAVSGMLLPAAGHKGFGLAMMVDVLTGMLSTGGWGESVNPLYGDPSIAYNCSHFFLAIDVSAFRPIDGFKEETEKAVRRVKNSRHAPGTGELRTPGEGRSTRLQASNDVVSLPRSVLIELADSADRVGVELAAIVETMTEGSDNGQI